MILLSRTYIFYADVYVVQNFVIKIAVLYFALYCNKYHMLLETGRGIGKIILAALAGTITEIAGLFLGNSYYVFLILVHVFEIPLMIGFLLGKERQQWIKVIITGYFFVMAINAVLEILWNYFGAYGNYVFWLCASCGLVYMGIRMYRNYSRIQKGIFPVEMFHNGNHLFTYGFYDSGNRLVDPYTQKGVHIISEELFQKIGLDKEHAVVVPYRALGNEGGMLEVYYVENFIIGDGKQRKSWKKCPMGVTKENLFKENFKGDFKGKKYEIILNEEVF